MTGSIEIRRDAPGVTVVSLRGEHDASTGAALRSELRDALLERRATVVELTPATFVDSSILGAIIGAMRRARESGLGFTLVVAKEPEQAVARAIAIGGLDVLFPIFETASEAVGAALAGVNAPVDWPVADLAAAG